MKSLFIFFVAIFYLAACNGPTGSGTSEQNADTPLSDLRVPSGFDWKTQTDVTFRLSGYETSAVRFVSKDGTVYHRANLIEDNEYVFKLTVPAYMQEIKVIYRGQEKTFELDRSEVVHSFTAHNS